MKKQIWGIFGLAAFVIAPLFARAITDEELRGIVPAGFSRASVITVGDNAVSAPLTNFPVLVKIEAGAPTGFQYSDLMFPSTGEDLGFVDMEGNGLPFEIDEWNTSGTSVLWVNVPVVTNGAQFVMVYRSAQTGKSLNANNPFADYVGVWHLGETASGSTPIKDSTDNHLNGTSPANSSPRAEGAIGGSRRINTNDNLNGSAQCIQVSLGAANSAARAAVDGLVPEFTASFWWRHPANFKTRWNQLIGRKLGPDDPTWHLVFDLNSTTRNQLRVYTAGTDGNKHYATPKSPQTTCEVWYKLDLIYYLDPQNPAKGRYKIYFNGSDPVDGGAYADAPAVNSTGDFYIGGSGGSRAYLGWMDEVRIRKFIPTADWVKAEYDQATSSSFLSKAGVVEFTELPKPVIAATRGDFGAAFVQFSGSVSKLGGAATSCDVYAKVWPVGSEEPTTGTLLAPGLVADGTFTDATVTNLTPQTEYNWAVYAINDLTPTAYESDPVTGTFKTAGVGGAGTGGIVSRVVDDYVHVFEIDLEGTATYSFTPPTGVTAVEALLVAGGGPGGYYAGGGGGAGGLVHTNALELLGGTTYTVTVGAGGKPSSNLAEYGTNGGDSFITSDDGSTTNAIAFGGGAGGNGPFNNVQNAQNAGCNGGSGGGSTHWNVVAGSGMTGQGSAGGIGLFGSQSDSKIESGGGGGAGGTGSPGSRGSSQFPGAGGNGVELLITGKSIWYAGGGSGGGEKYGSGDKTGYPTPGGNGGGGRGGMQSDIAGDEIPTAGTDGLGGGGGGGSAVEGKYMGAPGGSGVVVVRYPATGTGSGATEPTISLTDLVYDAENNKATISYRVAWAGAGYQTANVSAIWGYSEDALVNEVPLANTGVIGRGTGIIENLPSVSRTIYVKLKATNAGNASGVSTETKTIALYNPRAPEATIENTTVTVDGGTFSVDVTSLGKDASSAVVSLQSCANRAFTSGVVTNADLATLSGIGAVTVDAIGLADSSLWWVRAVLTNNIEQVYETDPISITTLTPGYPNASGTISVHGYTSVSASTKVTNKGLGSTETTRWLEVSESDDDFSTLVGTSTLITSTATGVDGTLTVTGLSPGTVYHLRIAISNTWNRTAYVLLPDFTTRSEPFMASGPTWTSGDGSFDFSLNVGGVYDGASCSATLTYGGSEIETKNFTEAGTVSWNGVAAAADGAIAKIVVTATLPNDGGTFTKTYESPVAAGSSGQVVSDVSAHFSAVNALWMKPGDVVDLPTPIGVGAYQVLNERFACLDGDNLIALEPGIVGVRCVDENYVTNVMGVVILPDRIGNGSVYVYDEKKYSDDSWTKAVSWKKVDGATTTAVASNDSWPCNEDDIAILPFYERTGDQYIRHRTDITLGGLYAGQIRPDQFVNCHLERFKDVDIKTVTFRRTDGQPVDVKACPNSEGGNYSRIVLAGYDIDVVWASDAIIDGCSSETDVNGPRGRFYVKTSGSTNTLQNVTLTFRGFPGYKIESNGCTDTLKGVWKGSGTIVKDGMGGIAFDGDFSGFDGTIHELSGPNLGGFDKGAAGVLMRAAAASNTTASIYGFVAANASGIPQFNGLGQGYFATGFSSVGPEGAGQAPGKGLYMNGGSYFSKLVSGTWGVGEKDEKLLDVLSVGAGMSFLRMDTPDNSKGQPINAVTAKTLAQTGKGTFFFYDPSVNNNAATAVTNNMFTVQNWGTHAVGGSGYGEAGIDGATNTFKIVPWFVSAGASDHSYLMFPAVDSNGRLVRPVRTCTYIDEAGSEDANATCWIENNTGYGSLTHGTATDIVLNSLFLNNSTKGDKYLGANRTLTIKSGGLIFQGNGSAIGLPGGGTNNGSLVLGDVDHPAYVWNKAFGNYTNQIWAAVTAAGGFVSTYTGNLELGGDQTGIAGEIVVAAGCLALGNSEHGIQLKAGLPVRVCAGATLKPVAAKAIERAALRIDGSAEAFGKVELSRSQICASLAVRDVYESTEWDDLPEGTYGSSESAAEFVRDDIFTGPGVLRVGAAPTPSGLMFMIY